MSKKEKLKFKKRIKEQILQEMSRAETISPTIARPEPIKEESMKESTPDYKSPVEKPTKNTNNLDFIRYDLKKSAIIIGSIIATIVIVFFIDNKTGFLLKMSDSLFKVLHINS